MARTTTTIEVEDLKAQLGPEGRAKFYERIAERLRPDRPDLRVGDVWTNKEIWQVLTEILEGKGQRH